MATIASASFFRSVFACVLLGAALRNARADKECEPSELGYSCMKLMAPYFKVHWSLGGDSSTELLGGEVPVPEEGEIAFALEGATTGYVGFGFTEAAGRMSPADIVLGWTNSEETLVQPYRAVTIDITDSELDETVTLEDIYVSEKEGTTIVAYTRSFSDGTVEMPLDKESEVIYAIASQDELAWHVGDRDGGTILLGRALEGPEAPAPNSGRKAATKVTAAKAAPAEEKEKPPPAEERASLQCQKSSLPGYDCSRVMPGELVTLHWVLGPVEQLDDALPAPKDGEISIAMVGKTEGYVGFAFTEKSGKMNPALTIMGWMTSDGDFHVKPYWVTSRTITESDEDKATILTGTRGSEQNGYTTIEFTQKKPHFLPSFEGALSINVAVADDDSLVRHSPAQRWSAELDFLSGSSQDSTKDLIRFYNWHGAIMLVSWMFLAQVGILVGSHKWVVPFGGQGGWFKTHRGAQTLTLLGTLAGVLIGLLKFDEHEMTVAKVHRLFGYIIFSLGWLQGFAGFLRPDKDHPRRYLFNLFHKWGGFLLGYGGPATVLLGIYSYREIENISIGRWLLPSVVSLAVVGGISILLHFRGVGRPRATKKAEANQTNHTTESTVVATAG